MAAFPLRGTGHPWKEALRSPVESRHGAANPTRATQGVGVDGQMEHLGSMDEKHMKYWQGHLFPHGLDIFSGFLMTRKIFSGKEALTWPPFLERFLAHLCALH